MEGKNFQSVQMSDSCTCIQNRVDDFQDQKRTDSYQAEPRWKGKKDKILERKGREGTKITLSDQGQNPRGILFCLSINISGTSIHVPDIIIGTRTKQTKSFPARSLMSSRTWWTTVEKYAKYVAHWVLINTMVRSVKLGRQMCVLCVGGRWESLCVSYSLWGRNSTQ